MNYPVKLQDQVQIKIDSLSAEGEGIGSYCGLRIFVAGALPQEEVKIEIIETKPRFARARPLEWVARSSARISPICPLFGECGGCQIMHLSYAEQLKAKRERVQQALRRIGHIESDVAPCEPSPSPLFYRSKIQMPVRFDAHGAKVGLFKQASHDLVEVERCFIQNAQGENMMQVIKAEVDKYQSIRYLILRNSIETGEALLLFVTLGGESDSLARFGERLMQQFAGLQGVVESINRADNNVILGPSCQSLVGKDYYHEAIGGLLFRISAPSFFQVNPEQARQLFSKAIELAHLKPSLRILDAYTGVGVLALLSAPHVKEVVGLEVSSSSIQDARINAARSGIANAQFFVAKAEERLASLGRFDLVYLNPTRKGCDERLLEALLKEPPRDIVYISCDPATLARDLAILKKRFAIKSVHPFDMFPQTMHVETIAHLNLIG